MLETKQNEVRKSSCITDKPVPITNDSLKAQKYARALCDFIKNADTPITIGIQGGWGSGKTSMFKIMQHLLAENKQANFIEINAWEHSLFQANAGQSQVVLSIMQGLIEALTDGYHLPAYIQSGAKGEVLKKSMTSALSALRSFAPLAFAVGATLATGTAFSVPQGKTSDGSGADQIPRLAKIIKDLKEKLTEQIASMRSGQEPVNTVIFIDDLDRVPPATAVEILDVLKNVFDIERCIFVMAIDYEVIVKGLESKYGVRNEKNEREFRQYFDKIIQIPFTMPVGAYSGEMKSLLTASFEKMDLGNGKKLDDIIEHIASISKLATGGIPRSIKRILNTLSLLQYIARDSDKEMDKDEALKSLLVRYIVVSLHINFPEICRRLMEKADFTKWTPEELNVAWQLKLDEKEQKDLKAISKNHDIELYFDEPWEQVIYYLCAKNEWLKLKAYSVSKIFNILRNILNCPANKLKDIGDESVAEDLTPEGKKLLSEVLSNISVVSVDMPQGDSSEKIKYDDVSIFFRDIHTKLNEGPLRGKVEAPTDENFAKAVNEDEDKRIYPITLKDPNILEIGYTLNINDEPHISVHIWANKIAPRKEINSYVKSNLNKYGLEEWMPLSVLDENNKRFKLIFSNFNKDSQTILKDAPNLLGQSAQMYKLTQELIKNIGR